MPSLGNVATASAFADLRMERVRVAFETLTYCFLAIFFVIQIVEAVYAITHVAEFAVREAITVQFQALRFGAVAWLTLTRRVVRRHLGTTKRQSCKQLLTRVGINFAYPFSFLMRPERTSLADGVDA